LSATNNHGCERPSAFICVHPCESVAKNPAMKAKKVRADVLLVQRGLVDSREKAQRLILAGKVRREDQPVSKPGQLLDPDTTLQLEEKLQYVSRGGWKLEKALDEFHINVEGKVALDVGASTGGFSDCLLQRGARFIYAVDVGYGQLAWKLQQDARVVMMDRVNARNLTKDQFHEDVDLATIDVSFIGLSKILPALFEFTKEAVALLKPQFEAGPVDVPRGGVIRDPKTHRKVLEHFYKDTGGWRIFGLIDSPILGSSGNREFLVHLKKQSDGWNEQKYLQKVRELTE